MSPMLRKKFLIVDDDELLIRSTHRKIQTAGFDAILARNGKEAVEKATEELPDLILLDLTMPQMNGYEVCRQIRVDERTKNIPIIVITGLRSENDSLEARISGANVVITKPIDEKVLLQIVQKYISSPLK